VIVVTLENTQAPPQPEGLLAGAEQHSIDFIPDGERHGTVRQQGIFWFLSNTQSLSVAVGFLGPSLGLSLAWTVVALVVGTLIGTVFQALHASQGPHLGLPQVLQSRAQFGYAGVVIPLLAALFSFLAYTVLDSIILGLGFHSIFSVPKVLTIVVSGVAGVALAVYGYDWLHRIFTWSFWISLPLWGLLTLGILLGHAGGKAPVTHGGVAWVAFAAQVAYAASINLSYAPCVSDYSRYLPRATPFRAVIFAVYAGASLSLIWLGALGAWLATRLGATDALQGMDAAGNHVVPGFGHLLVVVSSVVLVVTVALCAYSAALTILTAGSTVRPSLQVTTGHRARITLVLGIVWVIAGAALVDRGQTAIYDLILLVFYVLVPWSAINLVDYFFVRKGRYAITHLDKPDGIYRGWAWRGAVAYAVGLLAIVPFVQLSFWKGFGVEALQGVDVSYVAGLAVAGVTYYLITRSQNLGADEEAIRESETELHRLGLLSVAIDEGHEASTL
jgi:purine-cytosine permease-like protein